MTSFFSRRTILKSAAVGAAIGAKKVLANENVDKPELKPHDVILFQGDSITDAGRSRKNRNPNNSASLGNGYAMMIGAHLLANHPGKQLQIHNRGVSGNRVDELHKRWQVDCIDLKPNWISILIGVNDIWHKLNGNFKGTVDSYASGLSDLIARTKTKSPDAKIVICEPFVLKCGAVSDKWFPEFDHRRKACHRVADDAQCVWVPFQSMFDRAISENIAPHYWAGDGVHPSLAGHALMAKTWMESVFG